MECHSTDFLFLLETVAETGSSGSRYSRDLNYIFSVSSSPSRDLKYGPTLTSSFGGRGRSQSCARRYRSRTPCRWGTFPDVGSPWRCVGLS